jgi:phospholipid/cholesterol/gamma-HCH transport system substrate-binding protein
MVSVVALTILATLLYLLTGGTLLKPQTLLYLYIPDATGLAPDAPVRADGIQVGKVVAVNLTQSADPARIIQVTLKITEDALEKLPDDSYAELSAETMIGDMYVDITTKNSRNHLAPGSEIRYKPPSEFLKTNDIRQFEAALRDMDAILTDIEQGRGRVGELVQGDLMYRNFRNSVGRIEGMVRSASSTTDAVGQALYTDRLYRQMRAPILSVDASLAQIQSGQGTAGRLLRDTAQYDQFQALAASIRESVRNLAASDFFHSDQMYADWNRLVISLIQGVDAFNANPLLNRSDSYDSLNGAAKEMRDTLKDFRENPRKYMRLKVF